MADLAEVISGSLANAGMTGEGGEETGGDSAAPEQATDRTSDSQADAAPGPTDDAGAAAAEGDPAPAVDTPEPEAAAETAVPAKKQGPIPFEKHKKILDNERIKTKEVVDALNARVANLQWAESPEAKARVMALSAAETHPELFAKALLSDEKLGPVFRSLIGAQAPAAPAAATAPLTERPKPNVVDAQGNLGYDEAGLESLLQWTRDQAKADAVKAFDEKLKPFEPLVKRHEAELSWKKDVAAIDRALAVARRWDGWEAAEPQIKAWFQQPENRGKSLEDAYQAVVIPRFKTDEQTMRSKILAELNAKKGISVAKPAATSVAAVGGKKDLADVIRQSIEGLQ